MIQAYAPISTETIKHLLQGHETTYQRMSCFVCITVCPAYGRIAVLKLFLTARQEKEIGLLQILKYIRPIASKQKKGMCDFAAIKFGFGGLVFIRVVRIA